jgi:ABC-type methionine transport system ATPase subunit
VNKGGQWCRDHLNPILEDSLSVPRRRPRALSHRRLADPERGLRSTAASGIELVVPEREPAGARGDLPAGQRQRVAIARALVSKPTVMFPDEPTGNLDSITSAEILELMHSSIEAYGQTTVMVTHDPHAAAIAERILFLAPGGSFATSAPPKPLRSSFAMQEVSGR